MEDGRESVVATCYEGGAGAGASASASGSASGGRDDNSASGSLSPTPSPSASPPPAAPLASAVATSAAAAPGGVGMGVIMGAGMAPHQPLGFGGVGRVVGTGMVQAASMMAGGNNAGVGEDLSRKQQGRPTNYGPAGMQGGASLMLAYPASSVVHFSGELSSESCGAKRRRGRPRGSGRRQLLAALGEWFAYSAGGNFTPHIVTIATGEDVATRILSFSHKGPRAICILSANGSVSNVTLRQPGSSGGTLTYEGRFEIISLSGSFAITENGGIRSRTGGISVSLAGPDGRVIGGGVAGLLLAASPIQVVVGSFLPNVLKPQKQRPYLHSPPFSTTPPTSGVPTAARPLSQTNPDDECRAPTSTLHGHSHGETQNHMSNSTLPTYSSFQPVGWRGLQSSSEQKPSPDINVCLTGE